MKSLFLLILRGEREVHWSLFGGSILVDVIYVKHTGPRRIMYATQFVNEPSRVYILRQHRLYTAYRPQADTGAII